MSSNIAFDGRVGDMGSNGSNATIYEMGYTGNNLEGLKEFVRKRAMEKSLKILGISERYENGKWLVSMRVSSERGII